VCLCVFVCVCVYVCMCVLSMSLCEGVCHYMCVGGWYSVEIRCIFPCTWACVYERLC